MASSDAVAALRAQEIAIITQIAGAIVQTAKTLSSWSAHITAGWKIYPAVEIPSGVMITIGNKAPEALAFERGSGIHGPSGEKYIIAPVNAPALVFPGTHEWEGQTIVAPPMGGGVVHHPGVAARPYLHPANEAVKPMAMAALKQAFRDTIKLTIREAWNPNA
jgi:hypothetical protein